MAKYYEMSNGQLDDISFEYQNGSIQIKQNGQWINIDEDRMLRLIGICTELAMDYVSDKTGISQ